MFEVFTSEEKIQGVYLAKEPRQKNYMAAGREATVVALGE